MTPDDDDPFQKSDDFEQFIEKLNNAVTGSAFDVAKVHDPSRISAQIVGLPRSGTTVLYQLLARTRCVGYPSNIMALFWRRPTVGAQIQKHFMKNNPTLSLNSFAGRTTEPMDPHEFGYFWRAMLGHSKNSLTPDDDADTNERLRHLRESLIDISETFSSPVIYKNFLALAYAEEMRKTLNKAKFIVTERPLLDIAASLLILRRKLRADLDEWIGVKPPNSDSIKFHSQIDLVAYQVAALERVKQSGQFEQSEDTFTVHYQRLCENPRSIVGELLDFVEADHSSYHSNDLPTSVKPGHGAAQLYDGDRRKLESAIDSALRLPA